MFLLAHFDEEKQPLDQCCDIDGIEIRLDQKEFKPQKKELVAGTFTKIFKRNKLNRFLKDSSIQAML